MALYAEWQELVEQKQKEQNAAKFWRDYFDKEKEIYAQILQEKPPENTVQGYAEQFGVDVLTMTGFLDGINESLTEENPLETMEADTQVQLNFEPEKLYKNMVEAKADWLYGLPQWDAHLTVERRAVLYKEQKQSKTVVKGEKIGRNAPCPCGSGKKYKKCCGRDAS